MTPQSSVLVIAPIRKDRHAELRRLLDSMNLFPGKVNPENTLVPFQQFTQIHVARFVVLDDQTTGDLQSAYGVPTPQYPPYLAFVADFDGTAEAFRADIAARAGGGLEQIFSCCEGFDRGAMAEWMKDHEFAPATMYVNWVGRTVRQVREEDALRVALENHLHDNAAAYVRKSLREAHQALREFAYAQLDSGTLTLTASSPTPFIWWIRKTLHLVLVPVVLLLATPLLILYLPIFLVQLRSREKSDPVIAPRVQPCCEERLASLEDHDVTNQFTAMGTVKPGLFRRWTLAFFLWLLNWTTRHIYTRGQLARVPTIHFARWVFIDGGRRLLFASNYDGSLGTYMDDFINKVGWGLNLVFSNGVGYPSTRWLVLDGSKDEQRFKYFLRRHELPTNVWYKAYPGLTAFDLKRNSLIRQGIERSHLSDAELRQWIALL